MLTDSNVIMYIFSPLIAFFIFVVLKMFGYHKW